MEMTIQEHNQRKARSYKLLLIFAMVSMFMMFAGLTSAYIVSASRKDWVHAMIMPPSFTFSTIAIILGSITFHLAKKSIQKDNRKNTTIFLLTTLALAITFVICQFEGFNYIFKQHLFPEGGVGSINIAFLYLLVYLHLAHLAAGIISLLIIIYNHFKQKYNATQSTGIELGAIFWHFLDILWVYLFLFLYFV